MVSTKNIWKGVLKGDSLAQKELYEYSCDELMNVCRRYLSQSDKHLDALQEVYIKIFTKAKSYRPEKGSLMAWMIRIAVNECLQILRKSKRLNYVDLQETVLPVADTETAINKMSAEEIYELVAALPVGYRTVFNLYIVEGYNHNEIGEMLDISPSSSRSQLTRAKKMLKIAIKKNETSENYEEVI